VMRMIVDDDETDLVGVVVSRVINIVTESRHHQRQHVIAVEFAGHFSQYDQRICLQTDRQTNSQTDRRDTLRKTVPDTTAGDQRSSVSDS